MKLKFIFALSIFPILLNSCGFLDEYDPNKTTVGNFYKNESDITTSLNGVYASLTQSYYFMYNHYFTDVRAHDTAVTDSGANSGIPYQFYNYTLTEENIYVYNRYSQLFKTISRANTLLSHLGDVSYSNPDTRNSYEAQIRFIRALTYFYLVTEWGDVPLVLKELKTKDEVQANNYRRPKKEVYAAIFADLDFVTGSTLPDRQPASECGRVSKAAAWALYGKVMLQYACDEDFAAEKEPSLKTATEKLLTAWGLRNFGELSEIPFHTIWDLSTQKACAENIFQINYIQNNADLGSSWNFLYGPVQTGVTSNKVGQMQNVTTADFYNSYATGDVRKNYLQKTVVAGQTYYHTMKYADLDCGVNGYGGNNWIVLRYADVALMLSEAYYWQSDIINAQKYLNMVRKRAGLSNWSGTDLRQGIYDERRFELIQEGQRWQDMLRMYTHAEMIEYCNALNSNFSVKDLLLPIPYNERILNPKGLYQNPGYGVN